MTLNPTTTSFIGTFWYNFFRNHAGAYFFGRFCMCCDAGCDMFTAALLKFALLILVG